MEEGTEHTSDELVSALHFTSMSGHQNIFSSELSDKFHPNAPQQLSWPIAALTLTEIVKRSINRINHTESLGLKHNSSPNAFRALLCHKRWASRHTICITCAVCFDFCDHSFMNHSNWCTFCSLHSCDCPDCPVKCLKFIGISVHHTCKAHIEYIFKILVGPNLL